MQSVIEHYQARIRQAVENRAPLHICGGGSKSFYGQSVSNQTALILDTTAYHGIIDYEPTELVVTARAGTRLTDLESVLAQHDQMLAFESPHWSEAATLGGCVATGLSGPRRVSAGSVRDFVLGVRLLNGEASDLHFGGQVMKNVAGYDVSRLMVGAMGTLGVLLEVSLKVLPKPATEITLCMDIDERSAIERMNQWAGRPLPISATCYVDHVLYLRLSGAESAVRAAQAKLGAETWGDGEAFWQSVREQTHSFFQSSKPLWRLSINPTTAPLSIPGKQLMEWHGGLRWVVCEDLIDAESIRSTAKAAGGQATLFRHGDGKTPVFHPLSPGVMKIHRALKEKFDPQRIFNPGRFYSEL